MASVRRAMLAAEADREDMAETSARESSSVSSSDSAKGSTGSGEGAGTSSMMSRPSAGRHER